jgi:hypothetical protein
MNSFAPNGSWPAPVEGAVLIGTAVPSRVRPARGLAPTGHRTVWLVTGAGTFLGLAGGLVIADLTGDFSLPPLLGASFGGAISTAVEL